MRVHAIQTGTVTVTNRQLRGVGGGRARGIPHFARSEIVVARGEYEAATGRGAELAGYLPKHLPGWFAPRLVEGEHTVADGVRVIPTPGHTPNHQSVVVTDGDRTLFVAGDLTYSEELLREGAVDGVTQDPETAAATVAKARAFVDEHDAVFLPAHDPDAPGRLEAAA